MDEPRIFWEAVQAPHTVFQEPNGRCPLLLVILKEKHSSVIELV